MEEILKYIDIFGTKSYFFTNKQRKFYTLYGGILSLVLIIIIFSIFFLLAEDDFQRRLPSISFISEVQQENDNIILEEEKIWIPWRIVSGKSFQNNTGLLSPILSYNINTNNITNKTINLRAEKINYQLCNETSLINLSDFIFIDVPLNKLYCIGLENLKSDDSYKDSKINYIKLEFYLYEDEIDDNDNDSEDENLRKLYDNDDSLKIELYYPKVYHNPTNKKNPFSITYNPFIYKIYKLTYKINYIYLQKQILIDDQGVFIKSNKNHSYWSVSKIDEKITGDISDINIINKSSNLNVLTLNFYFDKIIIHYYRSYKKIMIIISEVFPNIYILYWIFNKITKIFKSSEQNKLLNELLFENLVGKVSKFNILVNQVRMSNGDYSQVPNANDKSELADLEDKKYSLFNKSNQSNVNMKKSNNNIVSFINQKSENQEIYLNPRNDNSKAIILKNEKNVKINNNLLNLDNQKLNYCMNRKPSFCIKDCMSNDLNMNINNFRIGYNSLSPDKRKERNCEQSVVSQDFKKYENVKLFPYRYYFFLIFCKNLDINKKTLCMGKRFTKANSFINQLMDISSYVMLQREFQVLKRKLLTKEKIHFVEKNKKINISNQTFIRDINECLEQQKFNILANS